MRRKGYKAQMQVAAAILLALATATTVVAINTTTNYTSNITNLLPLKITDYFSKTIEIWAKTSLELDENLRLWLRLDNGTTIKETPIFVNYSSGNHTENLNVTTNQEGFYPLNLSTGNYSINASYLGGNFTLPVFKNFEVEILSITNNETQNESTIQNNQTNTNTSFTPPLNQSENATTEEINQSVNNTPSQPVIPALLNSEIILPNRITRNNAFEIKLNLTNTGDGNANNLNFTWTFPSGFEILSENVCTQVKMHSFCVSKIIVTSNTNTSFGHSEGKLIIHYTEDEP